MPGWPVGVCQTFTTLESLFGETFLAGTLLSIMSAHPRPAGISALIATQMPSGTAASRVWRMQGHCRSRAKRG